MTTYGLTSDGFVPKTLTDIKTETEADIEQSIGIAFAAAKIAGQIVGILSERAAEVWDAAQAVHAAFDPDLATGAALDSVCALTGTVRLSATHSTVTLTLTNVGGVGSTVVPAGSCASVAATGIVFETLASATIPAGGSTTVAAQAVDTGPLPGLTGTITTIDTPVDGWTSVTNGSDAVLGRDVESDADLRLRRETELRSPANAAVQSVRAHLLALDGVTGCVVFENTTSVTDGDGIPPYHIRCVVNGGTAADILEAIFESKAAGTGTYGNESGTVVDDQGISHTVYYDEATIVPVWVILNVTKDPLTYPADGDQQIEDAVLAYGTSSLVMGKNVVAGALAARAFTIPGVLEVECLIGLSDPPTASTTLPISITEQALLDSARVEVNSVDGTP